MLDYSNFGYKQEDQAFFVEYYNTLMQGQVRTLFVRVDDDVVYIERGAFSLLVAHKLFHKSKLFRWNIIRSC